MTVCLACEENSCGESVGRFTVGILLFQHRWQGDRWKAQVQGAFTCCGRCITWTVWGAVMITLSLMAVGWLMAIATRSPPWTALSTPSGGSEDRNRRADTTPGGSGEYSPAHQEIKEPTANTGDGGYTHHGWMDASDQELQWPPDLRRSAQASGDHETTLWATQLDSSGGSRNETQGFSDVYIRSSDGSGWTRVPGTQTKNMTSLLRMMVDGGAPSASVRSAQIGVALQSLYQFGREHIGRRLSAILDATPERLLPDPGALTRYAVRAERERLWEEVIWPAELILP